VIVRDEESASLDTLEPMLAVMRESEADRHVLVVSDLSDAKGNSRKRQRYLGKIAAQVADVAVFVGEHGHHAVRTALEAGMDPASCHSVMTPRRAAELLLRELRAGDLVFIKGRASHHLSRVVFAQLGTIGCWSTTCKIRYLCDICPQLEPSFDLASALSAPLSRPSARVETRAPTDRS
jgi:UDP-N-acetylmuramyl pentapeptide synthase